MDFHQVKVDTINDLKIATTSYLTLWYFKLLLRCRITTQNIWFFNECLKNEVFPRYIQLKTKNNSPAANQGRLLGQRKWLTQDRKSQYRKRDTYNIYVKVIHSELAFRLSNLHFDLIDSKIRSQVNNIIDKKFKKQNKKLNLLISKKAEQLSSNARRVK